MLCEPYLERCVFISQPKTLNLLLEIQEMGIVIKYILIAQGIELIARGFSISRAHAGDMNECFS